MLKTHCLRAQSTGFVSSQDNDIEEEVWDWKDIVGQMSEGIFFSWRSLSMSVAQF